jgi:hypothetical protein
MVKAVFTMKTSTARYLARIPRPVRKFFTSDVTHLMLIGFLVGAFGYAGSISDGARAELLSNVGVQA